MIEAMIACLVLIPLFALIPLLGKFIDIRQSSIAASRKLAFECTVRPQACRDLDAHAGLVDQLRSRFFRGNGREVLAFDVPKNKVDEDAERNPLWVDRQGNALLENYSDVGARVAEVEFDPFGAASSLTEAGPKAFGLDPGSGLMEAKIQVLLSPSETRSFDKQLDRLALRMQQRTAILTESWQTGGPSEVKQRVKKANRVADVTAKAYMLLAQPALKIADAFTLETRGGQFKLNSFDPDLVPADRLREP